MLAKEIPNDAKLTTHHYGGKLNKVILYIQKTKSETRYFCLANGLPNRKPAKRNPYWIAMDAVMNTLCTMASCGMNMEDDNLKAAINQSLDRAAEQWLP